eukprot:TRINITY_DN3858_c0_g1_i10.p1 TRINITY_DN3858_c0_g1~~TRINITY_DN3858_c0_g1_i10.p1  ORF type:complete len:198 (-),score=35.36 TRINITY_DN3858_c0_g1_i10:116-709(-)
MCIRDRLKNCLRAVLLLLCFISISCEDCDNKDTRFNYDDDMRLCIYFGKDGASEISFAVKLTTDIYTMVKVPKSLGSSETLDSMNYFYLKAGGTQSDKYYYNDGKLTPRVSVAIRLDKGRVEIFEWDNDCSDCDDCKDMKIGSESRERNCVANSISELKIFVSFIGKDSDSRYMKSAQLRMSQFTRYSLKSLYNSIG